MADKSQPNDTEQMEVSPADEVEDSNPEETIDEDEETFTVQVGTTYSCKRQDGTYHDAEVLKSRMNKRAGREEFYVHYIGLNCRQNEWVDKTRLELVKPAEEMEETEEPANGTEEEAPENGSLSQEQAAEEEEQEEEAAPPEPKKIKLDPPGNSSVVVSDDLAEELTCLLCNDFFENPVVIECGHNFCRGCLDKAWEGQDSFTCPDCKEVITEKRYTCNRALAKLVTKTVGASAVPTTSANSTAVAKSRPPEKCLEHDERLKLYCKDDGDLSCVICRESLKHANHNFLPILDAVGVYRTELSSIVSPLEEALKVAEEMAKQQNIRIEKHKTNMQEYKQHIESEFQKLHDLLREREEKLLGELHVEGGSLLIEMEENVTKMQENIESIKESIAAASEKLGDTDSISFLTDIKDFIQKCQEQKEEALSSENSLISRELDQDTYMAPIQLSLTEEVKQQQQEQQLQQPINQKVKQIWIVGNSVISRAASQAKNSLYGENLRFDQEKVQIHWMSKRSMMWQDLISHMEEKSAQLGPPTVVIVYLGGSDVGRVAPFALVGIIKKKTLPVLLQDYPNTTFVWSSILPRLEWMDSHMNNWRKNINKLISNVFKRTPFQVMRHDAIEHKFGNPTRLSQKEALTAKEYDIFFKNIIKFIAKNLDDVQVSDTK